MCNSSGDAASTASTCQQIVTAGAQAGLAGCK
jgi:hypothetical protein